MLLPILSFAQSKEVRNYYDEDREQLKERYFVSDLKPTELYGTYESYYISGQLKSIGEYVDNEPIGQWKYYFENGQLKMKGHLKNNSNHGLWTYYFENGNKRMEGHIYDGYREGEWIYFYETGEQKSEGEYLNDNKNGLWNYYYEDGSLKGKAIYNQGNGVYKEFFPDGEVKMEGFITDGKSDSLWRNYYETGELKSKGLYKEGAKEGKWTYFYKSGNISGVGHFKDNLSHGKWTYYYPDGALEAEGAERAGKKEGYWKLYYEDGSTKGESVYEAGSGDYKEFYESGKLKLKGRIVDEKYVDSWIYYYETGEIEGRAEYDNGLGEYIGFYKDGTQKMKGTVDGQTKTGTWELYNENGTLAGFYKPVYDEYEPLLRQTLANEESKETPKYNKPEYRYRSKRISYMKPRNSDFPTIVAQVNPFNMLFGDLQISLEYNIQQRIGYEALLHVYRNPFFANSYNLTSGDTFFEGYGFSFRQRFYHKDSPFGMPYFGHSLGYQNIDHLKYYTNSFDNSESRATVKQQGIRYGLLVGTRILQNLNDNGFTFDLNVGVNFGYHFYEDISNTGDNNTVFDDLKNREFRVSPIVGVSIGYVFRLKKVSTLNP